MLVNKKLGTEVNTFRSTAEIKCCKLEAQMYNEKLYVAPSKGLSIYIK